MNELELKKIIEAVLFAVDHPMTIKQLEGLFPEETQDGEFQTDAAAIKQALESIAADHAEGSVELKEVSSGYRFQVKQEYAEWVSKLWEEKPARYSRATLETMALIAYRQPITRAEIEEVRGVSVSTTIIKTLTERDWIKVVGHRDVPGKPALYATTKNFLDYFNLSSLEDLPSLAEIRDIDSINAELDLAMPEDEQQGEHDALESEAVDNEMADAESIDETEDEGLDLAAELDSAMALADSIVETSQQAMRDRFEESDEETEDSVDDDDETVSESQAEDTEQANEDQTTEDQNNEEQAANDSDVEANVEASAESTTEVTETDSGDEEKDVVTEASATDDETASNETDVNADELHQALTAEN